ncbi:MAG: M20 family metallopeptidase [Spirochaetes bacterium]|nr:M20 family metallopeptidase [Spirochaetota bacterium]
MNKKQMYGFLDETKATLFDISDRIWEYAETSFEEFRSSGALVSYLAENGFTIEQNVAGIETAFCATWGSGSPVIGILAEYDALAAMSQVAGKCSKEELTPNGNGHGCGHNHFGTASSGAAVAVKKYMEANGRQGTVKLFGCPAEENGSGKAFMARGGAFNGLDVAFAWHPFDVNFVWNFSTLANYQVLYKFKGIASHAAQSPHKGRSALDAVELMNVGVNFLREHVIQEARIHYAITNAGGFSPNVVQPKADVLYLIRAPKSPQVEEIYQRVNKIAQGAALMTETEMEIQFVKACANVISNKTLSGVMYENFKELALPVYTQEEQAFAKEIKASLPYAEYNLKAQCPYLPEDLLTQYSAILRKKELCDILIPFDKSFPDTLLPASTDVGDVSWNTPTAQVGTACFALGTPMHSWQLVSQGKSSVAHKGLLLAAKIIAGSAVDCLESPEIVKSAKEELTKKLGGETYKVAIPDSVNPVSVGKL